MFTWDPSRLRGGSGIVCNCFDKSTFHGLCLLQILPTPGFVVAPMRGIVASVLGLAKLSSCLSPNLPGKYKKLPKLNMLTTMKGSFIMGELENPLRDVVVIR